MTPTPEAVASSLRRWARLSAAPLVVPRERPPNTEEVIARLREAVGLWVLCVRLGAVGRRLPE